MPPDDGACVLVTLIVAQHPTKEGEILNIKNYIRTVMVQNVAGTKRRGYLLLLDFNCQFRDIKYRFS